MRANEEQEQETDIPQLKVFSGEEGGGGDDRPPTDPMHEARREWLGREAYWAGRNRAKRISTRLVA